MKKKRQKSQSRKKPVHQTNTVQSPERRRFLSKSGRYAVGIAVIAAGSAFAVSAVRATARAQDLSRIGQGVPTVVQIHDPGCSLCTALQKETRKALSGFDPSQLDYVVANVKTDEGRAFAAKHRQPHVTLMLMDPEGNPVRVLNGPQDREHLAALFAAHAAAFK